MLSLPKKNRKFGLRFEQPETKNTEPENKNGPERPRFKVPESAEYKLSNKVPEYVVTLVEGELPNDDGERKAKLLETEDGTPGTRQAILFAHFECNPLEVKHEDWVLHDGSSLSQGTANAILLHRETAELMNGWDIVYKISPHPRKAGEVAIRAIYLCPVGTMETCAVDDNAPACANCERPSTFACKCQSAFFCSTVCRDGAQRTGAHDDDECLREYAARLVERSAHEREKAIQAGTTAAKANAESAVEQSQGPHSNATATLLH